MGCISARAYRVGGISSASANRIDGIIAVAASRIGGIKASASLICDNGSGNYLRVTPTETQWVDVYTSVEYTIRTKENWSIE